MAAGSELFSERGFDGVAIEDLAARAGVNKALVSYHFGGKRGLYVAILDSAFAAIAERLKAIEAEAGSAREALHGYVRAFEQMARERPGFPTLFLREVLCSGIEPRRRCRTSSRSSACPGASPSAARARASSAASTRSCCTSASSGASSSSSPPSRPAARLSRRASVPFAMPTADSFVRYLEELTLRGLAPGTRPPIPRRKGARA